MTESTAPYTTAADDERKPWLCKCGYPLGSVLRDTLTITAEEPAGLIVDLGPECDGAKVHCPDCGGSRDWHVSDRVINERQRAPEWSHTTKGVTVDGFYAETS